MSLPSDVTPDVPPSDAEPGPTVPRARRGMSRDEQGWLVAAIVAFLGIVYVGPAIARYRRRPTLRQRLTRRMHEAERRTRDAGRRARKRVSRLGGGSLWR